MKIHCLTVAYCKRRVCTDAMFLYTGEASRLPTYQQYRIINQTLGAAVNVDPSVHLKISLTSFYSSFKNSFLRLIHDLAF